MKYAPFLSVCALLLLASLHAQAATCHVISDASQTPSGYASPVSFFSNDLMIKGDCNSNSVAVTVGNNESTTYVYETSYQWTGSQWTQRTLTGSNKQGVWIPKQATTNFTSSQSPTYYVAYTCEWTNDAWKCGCQNQACSQPQWQMQMFTTSQSAGLGGSAGAGTLKVTPNTNRLEYNGQPTRLYGVGLILNPEYPTADHKRGYERNHPGKKANDRMVDEINNIRQIMGTNWLRIYINPSVWKKTSKQDFFAFYDPFVARAKEQGMFVDFVWWVVGWPDVHAQYGHDPSWSMALDFAETLARHYDNQGHVSLTFWDEPETTMMPAGHPLRQIGDTNEWQHWQPLAQEGVDRVRSTGSDILLFIPGGQFGRAFNTWEQYPIRDPKNNFCLSVQGYSDNAEFAKLEKAFLTTKRSDGSTYRVDDEVCTVFGVTGAYGTLNGTEIYNTYDPAKYNRPDWLRIMKQYALDPNGSWNGISYWAWDRWAQPRMIPDPYWGWPRIDVQGTPGHPFDISAAAKWYRDQIPNNLVRP